MIGILNVNKPSGVTSRFVVDRAVRLVRPAKAGHAGTLDPLASGVLLVCIGGATRLVEFLHELPKTYHTTFLLGRSSPTDDVDGEVILLDRAPVPSLEALHEAALRLTGRIMQRPPVYSALKVAGRRAYDLARRGETVELAEREVIVHRLSIVRYDYPELELDIECGSGTYVRSLGRDLAESVGTAAVMSALVRTAIGEFTLASALALDALTVDNLPSHLLPPRSAVAHLPHMELDAPQLVRIAAGMTIDAPLNATTGPIAAIDTDGLLRAVLVERGAGRLGPALNIVS